MRILCWLFEHKYKIESRDFYFNLLKCARCGKRVCTMRPINHPKAPCIPGPEKD